MQKRFDIDETVKLYLDPDRMTCLLVTVRATACDYPELGIGYPEWVYGVDDSENDEPRYFTEDDLDELLTLDDIEAA